VRLLLGLVALAGFASGAEKTESIAGKLIVHAGHSAVLETATHKPIELDGDQHTRKVLQEERLNGMEVQATGHFTASGKFLIDPEEKHALLVRQQEKLKTITYWCDVCKLRSYTPGPCVCCDGDTALELRDPETRP
jgi:hypothetical protein